MGGCDNKWMLKKGKGELKKDGTQISWKREKTKGVKGR